jgi:uncharacterized protein YqgV (UPF0045/DUF77 family)
MSGVPLKQAAPRITTNIRLGTRTDRDRSIEDKIRSAQDKIRLL